MRLSLVMALSVHRRKDRKRAYKTRVWLNGVEVTDRCYYVDARRGVVRLYKHDENGKKYLEPILNGDRRIATEEKRGIVRTQIKK